MADIYLWKLALDGALVASLLYMCLRFRGIGGPNVNIGHMRELESSLKRLLKEAERSSTTLGEELGRKKGQLEQLLFDIETAEQRINRSLDEASELKRALIDASRRAGERPIQEAPATQNHRTHVSAPEARSVSIQNEREATYEPQSPVAPQYEQSIPEPPSFESLRAGNVSQPMPKAQQRPQRTQQATSGAVNIYGEPIENNASLRESIEKETTPQMIMEAHQPVEQSLEDLYGAADDLLRAGQSLEHVARTTALPLDEVRMLSELIAREQYVQEQSGEGSPVKRETQVL